MNDPTIIECERSPAGHCDDPLSQCHGSTGNEGSRVRQQEQEFEAEVQRLLRLSGRLSYRDQREQDPPLTIAMRNQWEELRALEYGTHEHMRQMRTAAQIVAARREAYWQMYEKAQEDKWEQEVDGQKRLEKAQEKERGERSWSPRCRGCWWAACRLNRQCGTRRP